MNGCTGIPGVIGGAKRARKFGEHSRRRIGTDPFRPIHTGRSHEPACVIDSIAGIDNAGAPDDGAFGIVEVVRVDSGGRECGRVLGSHRRLSEGLFQRVGSEELDAPGFQRFDAGGGNLLRSPGRERAETR